MSFLFLPHFTRPSSLADPPPPFPFGVRLTYPCLHAFRPGGLGNPTRWRVTSGSGLFLDFLSEPYSRFPLQKQKLVQELSVSGRLRQTCMNCLRGISPVKSNPDMHEPAPDLRSTWRESSDQVAASPGPFGKRGRSISSWCSSVWLEPFFVVPTPRYSRTPWLYIAAALGELRCLFACLLSLADMSFFGKRDVYPQI